MCLGVYNTGVRVKNLTYPFQKKKAPPNLPEGERNGEDISED
jgi:hypothetical protein